VFRFIKVLVKSR